MIQAGSDDNYGAIVSHRNKRRTTGGNSLRCIYLRMQIECFHAHQLTDTYI